MLYLGFDLRVSTVQYDEWYGSRFRGSTQGQGYVGLLKTSIFAFFSFFERFRFAFPLLISVVFRL